MFCGPEGVSTRGGVALRPRPLLAPRKVRRAARPPDGLVRAREVYLDRARAWRHRALLLDAVDGELDTRHVVVGQRLEAVGRGDPRHPRRVHRVPAVAPVYVSERGGAGVLVPVDS